jgi:hypothetical protein
MKFEPDVRELLLAQPHVGPGILARLERAGYVTIEALASARIDDVLQAIRRTSPPGSAYDHLWIECAHGRRAIASAVIGARRWVRH